MTQRRSPPELPMRTVEQLLREAVEKLREAGADTPLLDAEVMLSRILACSRTHLLAHPQTRPPREAVEWFAQSVSRRSQREPLAYIVGEREFYGIRFEVTPAVLIPRPETEILVETAVTVLQGVPDPTVADVGVGSGAVAVSIAKSVPEAVVYATESSEATLEVAERNANRAGVSDRVQLLKGDLLEPLAGRSFDLIVSNPPYVPSAEIDRLEPEIAKYEPRQALDGGPDGLDYYRRLGPDAPEYLKAGGVLAVEVGAGQSPAVAKLFQANGFQDVRSVRDYSGIERVVLGERGRK